MKIVLFPSTTEDGRRKTESGRRVYTTDNHCTTTATARRPSDRRERDSKTRAARHGHQRRRQGDRRPATPARAAKWATASWPGCGCPFFHSIIIVAAARRPAFYLNGRPESGPRTGQLTPSPSFLCFPSIALSFFTSLGSFRLCHLTA